MTATNLFAEHVVSHISDISALWVAEKMEREKTRSARQQRRCQMDTKSTHAMQNFQSVSEVYSVMSPMRSVQIIPPAMPRT